MIAKVYSFTTGQEVDISDSIDASQSTIKADALYPFNLKEKIAQTAKAYGFRYFLVEYLPAQDACYFVSDMYWLPKSQMIKNFAPGWVIIAKAKDRFMQIIEQDSNLLDKAAEGLYDLDNIYCIFDGYKITMSEIEY